MLIFTLVSLVATANASDAGLSFVPDFWVLKIVLKKRLFPCTGNRLLLRETVKGISWKLQAAAEDKKFADASPEDFEEVQVTLATIKREVATIEELKGVVQ